MFYLSLAYYNKYTNSRAETLISQMRGMPNPTQPTWTTKNYQSKNLFKKKLVEDGVLFASLYTYIYICVCVEVNI